MTKRNIAALAAVILAAGLAGCGGDDGGGGSTSLTNYNTGPVPSSPAVGAVGSRTLLPSTADTHEVETDGNWIVWKARQINVGYFDGSAYRNLDLGLPGAVTPWAFNSCELSPIAFDGTRIAFVANDVSDAAGPAFFYGAPGGAMTKIDLPVDVTTTSLVDFKVAINGDMAGFFDDDSDALWVADLAAASPAFTEVPYTGTIVGPPGGSLLPISNDGYLELLDLTDLTGATVTTLTGDDDPLTAPEQLRFANGAFTWVEAGLAFFYAPGFPAATPMTDSKLITTTASGAQRNPVAGPSGTYVLWEEDNGTGTWVVKQRPWGQLGQIPNGTSIIIRTHAALLPAIGSLANVQTGMGFIAWLADPDLDDDVSEAQLFTYFVGTPPPADLAPVQVTFDEGSGWGNSDSVFLFVEGSSVFFKQEFTQLHSPGRVLKRYTYGGGTTTLLAASDYQQLPLALVSGGKVVTLTRDHSFRLFAKRADAAAAPIVVTPKGHDVKVFSVAAGKIAYAALDRNLYLNDPWLAQVVDALGNADFLVEIYRHDLAGGGGPVRLTYNGSHDESPFTDGTWVTWYDENSMGYAQALSGGNYRILGSASSEIRVDANVATWNDNNYNDVVFADLVGNEVVRIEEDYYVYDCPAISSGLIAWRWYGYDPGIGNWTYQIRYYDTGAATPAVTVIPGSYPNNRPETDGRFITWSEYRSSWDHDNDAGTANIASNVIVVHDTSNGTSTVIPGDYTLTTVGGGSEGPVCEPHVTDGVVVFNAVQYDVLNPDLDMEVYMYDAAAASPALVRLTADEDGLGLWDSRLRVSGNLAVFRTGGSGNYWGWEGKVPAVLKLK